MVRNYIILKDNKKYLPSEGVYLYQIQAIREFKTPYDTIKVGDIGGYIESYDNLDQSGNAWIYKNAMVYGNARVYGNAIVGGNAKVYGNARIYDSAMVVENAEVRGHTWIHGDSMVGGNAKISSRSNMYDTLSPNIYGNSRIYGSPLISGKVSIYDNAIVHGESIIDGENVEINGSSDIGGYANIEGCSIISSTTINLGTIRDAKITSPNDYAMVKGFGSINRTTVFYLDKNGIIKVICGCFYGTIDQFEERVKQTYLNDEIMNPIGEEYIDIANLIRKRFKRLENSIRKKEC